VHRSTDPLPHTPAARRPPPAARRPPACPLGLDLSAALLLVQPTSPFCPQSDPRQLGVTNIPSSRLPPTWRIMARDGRLPLPLDGANLHAFLTSAPDEEARRQVRGVAAAAGAGPACGVCGRAHRASIEISRQSGAHA
jgi:hypothetical protein